MTAADPSAVRRLQRTRKAAKASGSAGGMDVLNGIAWDKHSRRLWLTCALASLSVMPAPVFILGQSTPQEF